MKLFLDRDCAYETFYMKISYGAPWVNPWPRFVTRLRLRLPTLPKASTRQDAAVIRHISCAT